MFCPDIDFHYVDVKILYIVYLLFYYLQTYPYCILPSHWLGLQDCIDCAVGSLVFWRLGPGF